jgi:probable phosphoglycerate mutase
MPPVSAAEAPGPEEASTPEVVRQFRFTRPPGATSILLVRHGESAPSRPGESFDLVDGHGDPPLDPVGHQQAALVADRLAGEAIAAIYVSTLRRTAETAAPLAQRLGLTPHVEPDLREVFLGEWEGGLFRIRVAENHPIAQRMFAEERWDVIPGAEDTAAFAARVRDALLTVASRHPDQTIAVFTHGGVIGRALAEATRSRPFAFSGADNGSISHLVLTPEQWLVRAFNDVAHLHTHFTMAAEAPT